MERWKAEFRTPRAYEIGEQCSIIVDQRQYVRLADLTTISGPSYERGEFISSDYRKTAYLMASAPNLYDDAEENVTALEEAAKILQGGGFPGLASIFVSKALRTKEALSLARGETL